MPPADRPSAPEGGWLNPAEQRAWLAYIRVSLRLSYEMNRQLQADSGMSLADFDVLTALSAAPDGTVKITALASQIGWERSRLSHHVSRMAERGLIECHRARSDRRATEVSSTAEGRRALTQAAPGHVELVRQLFFTGVPDRLLKQVSAAFETIDANITRLGSPPAAGEAPPARRARGSVNPPGG
jgi:DNA-binding MarR family transcriptional regulator